MKETIVFEFNNEKKQFVGRCFSVITINVK